MTIEEEVAIEGQEAGAEDDDREAEAVAETGITEEDHQETEEVDLALDPDTVHHEIATLLHDLLKDQDLGQGHTAVLSQNPRVSKLIRTEQRKNDVAEVGVRAEVAVAPPKQHCVRIWKGPLSEFSGISIMTGTDTILGC